MTTDATWLIITSPTALSGTGDLTLSVTYPPNVGSSRTEHVTVTFTNPATNYHGSPETFTFQQWGPDAGITSSGNLGGKVGAPYSLRYSVVDGFPPISFNPSNTCSPGELPSGDTATGIPPGLTFGAPGLLSGTPTAAGTFTWCVGAYDAIGSFQSYWIAIIQPATSAAPISIGGPNVLSLILGSPASISYSASGGTPPYTMTVSSGSLPPGLTINGLTIAGTPAQLGNYSFTLKFSDITGNATTFPVNLQIVPGTGSGALTASGPTAPTLTVGTATSLAYSVSGGTPPYSMTLASGSLPLGLSISGLSLTGTPTQPGTYPCVLKFNDSASNTATLGVTVQVQVGPVLTISPTVLNFAALPGGGALDPLPISVTTNGISIPFSLNVTTEDGAAWLSASAANHNFNTPATVTVSVQPAILSVGTYYGHVFVTAPGAIGSALEALVTIIVSSTPTVTLAPSSISVTSAPGTPAQINAFVSVFTTGSAPIQARVYEGANWLTLRQIGTTSPVTLVVQGQQTTPGTALGVIRIDTPNNTPSSVDIPVTAVALPPLPGPIS